MVGMRSPLPMRRAEPVPRKETQLPSCANVNRPAVRIRGCCEHVDRLAGLKPDYGRGSRAPHPNVPALVRGQPGCRLGRCRSRRMSSSRASSARLPRVIAFTPARRDAGSDNRACHLDVQPLAPQFIAKGSFKLWQQLAGIGGLNVARSDRHREYIHSVRRIRAGSTRDAR